MAAEFDNTVKGVEFLIVDQFLCWLKYTPNQDMEM
jgi:hypothetical protein